MSGAFDFSPNSQVPRTLPPDPIQGVSFRGWNFSAKPTVPYQRKFQVTIYGIQWLLQTNGLYDSTTNPTVNARRLELFYQANGTWDNFTWNHPHLGSLVCRFASSLTVPEGISGSNGLIDGFDVMLVEHNPGY